MPRFDSAFPVRRILALMLVLCSLTFGQQSASAAGTTLFNEPFHDNTVDGTGAVVLPALSATGTVNAACLSASGNSSTGVLTSCPTSTDAQGSGKLRLTSAANYLTGGVFGSTSVPTSQGLDVTFNAYQYGGSLADGIAFVAAATNPANPSPPATIGPAGGSLGYSAYGGQNGVADAYLGIGFDVFGNFSNNVYEGSGCTDPAYIAKGTTVPGQVLVRGPGQGTVGYCALASTATSTTSPVVALHYASRTGSKVPVEVVINPTAASFTTTSGLVVAAGTYQAVFTPIGGSPRTLSGALPVVPTGLYPSSSWTTGAGIPKQLTFGWVASTGGSTDFHEIDAANVVTFNAVPQLAVSAVSYNGSTPVPGGPVTYTVTPSVAAGANEASPVSVTETLPAGVVPQGAFGTGWVCQAPSGQQITCTNSNAPFTSGSSLSPITVVGIVTSSAVTTTTIQNGTTSTASSADGSPGTATATTAGTLPTAPSGITVTPASGPIAGGGAVTIGGSNIAGASAIEIGTTAQQLAGTPITLLPCATGVTVGCFSVNANGTLAIASMPTVTSAATMSVTVVTQGVAAAASYVYTSAPAAPAAPAATAGITSATVAWTAPASNGSAITGYTVTPYKAGVAQTPVTFNTTATTQTLTGLTAGSSYTFTVAAVNALGTGAASPASAAVTPYALPAAPTITTVTAGTSAATLTWSAPAANGSAITGYVVTPYVAGVAQSPRTFTGSATTQTLTGLTGGTAYTFTVAAQNAAGTGPASAASSAVTVNVPPSLTFAAPPGGEVGAAYSDALTVGGGTAPYTWSVSTGTAPPGLTLNASSGLLSGTPTAAGSYTFTVLVTDSSGKTASTPVTLLVAAPLALTAPAAPAGEIGVAYTYALSGTGGVVPYTWSVSAGGLPGGITLNASTGMVSGTPTTAGTFTATVQVLDALAQRATGTLTVTVVARPALSVPAGLSGQLGLPYGNQLSATGGAPPLLWSVSSGTLPPGLSLGAGTGLLSGTPTSMGSYSFTVTAADANAVAASAPVVFTVGAGPMTIVNSADVSSTAPGGRVHYTISITNASSATFSGVTVSDSLAGVLDDAAYGADVTASTGTAGFSGGVVTWTGTLAANAAATVTFSVVVSSPDTGDKILASAVTSSTLGTNCAVGGTDPRCASSVTVSQLVINNVASVPSTVPGGVVRFTLTATNVGQTPYQGISMFTSAAGVFDDANVNGDQVANFGSLSVTPTGVTWTGSIAVGAALTITGTVTVKNPDTGDMVLASTVTTSAPGSNCPTGTTDPRCSINVPVLLPGLTIVTSSNVPAVVPGGVAQFTVTVTNSGQTPYVGAAFTDSLSGTLDESTYNGDVSATSGTAVFSSPNVTWSGNLAVGASATVTFSVTTINPDNGGKLLTAMVTSSTVGSNCPAASGDARCGVNVVVLTPALTIVKSSDVSSVLQGGLVHYTIIVTNSGQIPYTGAAFTDSMSGVLDDASYNGDVSASSGTAVFSSPNLTWSGNLAVGASATVTYSVTVANPDTGDKTMINTVTSSTGGNNCPAGNSDNRCNGTVAVDLSSPLTISTTTDVSSVVAGGAVHYTVTVTNSGATALAAAFADSLSGVLDDAVYNGDVSANKGTAVFSSPNISWSGSLTAGSSAVITYSVTVDNPDTGDMILKSAVTSSTAGNNCPVNGSDLRCASTVTVSQLVINHTATASSTVPGAVLRFTFTAANLGQTPYQGISVFTSPSSTEVATPNGDETASFGTLSVSASGVTWTGDIPVGATLTVTGTVTVINPDPGDLPVATTVTTLAPGSNCPTGTVDPRCSINVPVLIPGLTIVNSASASAVVPGGVAHYTVTVTNSGQTPYVGAAFTDSLVGVLDESTYNGDVSATSGTAVFSSPNVTWSGDLAVGASATVTFSVTAINPDNGGKLLNAVVSSTTVGNNCPVASGDARCTSNVVVLTPVLTLAESSDVSSVVQGGVVHYTITVTNSGQIPYAGAAFADSLAGVLDDAVYNGDVSATSGTAVFSSPNVTWSGALALGASATITYSVTVDYPDTGDGTLTDVLTSSTSGSNCLSGNGCGLAIVATVPTMTLSSLTPGFSLGGLPGTTAELDDAVTMTVTTNSPNGYSVTAQAVDPALTSVVGNGESIPIADLEAREHGATTFAPLSVGTPLAVHSQNHPSALRGDTIGTDYEVLIPNVVSGAYSGSVEYMAMAL